MENPPFWWYLPGKMVDFPWAMLVYQRVYKKPIQGNCAHLLLPSFALVYLWGIRYPGPTPKGSRRSRLPTINFHRLFAVSFKYGNHGSMETGPFGDKTRLVQAPFSAEPWLWLFDKLVHQQKPAGSTKQTLTDVFKTCLFLFSLQNDVGETLNDLSDTRIPPMT